MGKISESQARLLLSVSDIGQQQLLFEEIIKNNLSVRQVKAKVDYIKASKAQERISEITPPDPETEMVKRELEEILGTPVRVERSGSTGRITIEFYSPEELHAIVERLTKKDEPPMPTGDPSASSLGRSQAGEAGPDGLPPGFTV